MWLIAKKLYLMEQKIIIIVVKIQNGAMNFGYIICEMP